MRKACASRFLGRMPTLCARKVCGVEKRCVCNAVQTAWRQDRVKQEGGFLSLLLSSTCLLACNRARGRMNLCRGCPRVFFSSCWVCLQWWWQAEKREPGIIGRGSKIAIRCEVVRGGQNFGECTLITRWCEMDLNDNPGSYQGKIDF